MPNSAESIVVQCAHCGKRFKGAAKLAGRTVKCPTCGQSFTVTASAATALPAARPAPVVAAPPPPAGDTDWPPKDEAGDFDALAAAANEAAYAPPGEFAPPPPGYAMPPGYAPPGYAPPGYAPPGYAPPPAQYAPQYAPPRTRGPVDPRLKMGLMVVGGVVVAGVLLYVLLFNSNRWKLAGTWQMKKTNNAFMRDASAEMSFSFTGDFSVTSSFFGKSRTATGKWEFVGGDRIKITIDPKSLPQEEQSSERKLSNTLNFEFVDSDTISFKSEDEKKGTEFVRK
jgi:phage FluMu protein Com